MKDPQLIANDMMGLNPGTDMGSKPEDARPGGKQPLKSKLPEMTLMIVLGTANPVEIGKIIPKTTNVKKIAYTITPLGESDRPVTKVRVRNFAFAFALILFRASTQQVGQLCSTKAMEQATV